MMHKKNGHTPLIRIINAIDKSLSQTLDERERLILRDSLNGRRSEQIKKTKLPLDRIAKKKGLQLDDCNAVIYDASENTQKYGGRFDTGEASFQVALWYEYKILDPITLLKSTRFENIMDKKNFMRGYVDKKVIAPMIRKILYWTMTLPASEGVASLNPDLFAEKLKENLDKAFMNLGMEIVKVAVEHVRKV